MRLPAPPGEPPDVPAAPCPPAPAGAAPEPVTAPVPLMPPDAGAPPEAARPPEAVIPEPPDPVPDTPPVWSVPPVDSVRPPEPPAPPAPVLPPLRLPQAGQASAIPAIFRQPRIIFIATSPWAPPRTGRTMSAGHPAAEQCPAALFSGQPVPGYTPGPRGRRAAGQHHEHRHFADLRRPSSWPGRC